MENVKVGDVMTVNVISMGVNDTVKAAAKVMRENDIASVLVMKDDLAEGIVTEKDIINKVVAEGGNPSKMKLKDIMSSPLIFAGVDDGIEDAAVEMRDRNIRRLPVTDGKKIVGIITDSDISRYHPALRLIIEEGVRLDSPEINVPLEGEEFLVEGVCENCENYTEKLRNIDGRWLCKECSRGGML
jgi:CBS domain-containing protein